MREAMECYIQSTAAGIKIAPISTWLLAVTGTLTFNVEWAGMATQMLHYERWGENGSPDEANRLHGTPMVGFQE